MKYTIQLTMVLCATVCLTVLLLPSSNVQGKGLRQPIVLTTSEAKTAAEKPLFSENDSLIKTTACCESECGCETGSGCSGEGCCGEGCCGRCCRCEPICCPRCVVGEVEKKCWNVKCDLICVPRFRWPWECCNKSKRASGADCGCAIDECCGQNSGCTLPKCGKVRRIKTLEQHKYTCKECGYEWDIKCVCREKKHR